MNLQQLREATRAQLDLDEEDYPNTRLDYNLREGFERTVLLADSWPSYATAWSLDSTIANPNIVTMTDDIASVTAVRVGGTPLLSIAHHLGEEAFSDTEGQPAYFSSWGNDLYLWPKPAASVAVEIRGYRHPRDWVAEGAAAEVDADPRLHSCLVHYACAREYAFQEDDVLEARWTQTWLAGAEAAKEAILRPHFSRPIILNRGMPRPGWVSRARWELS